MENLVCVWFLLYGSCLGRFVVEKNSLKMTSPDNLKDTYGCAIGNFGYGGTLVGAVINPKANQKACKSFTDVDISFKSKPGGLPIFLLADRGDYYFALKAWNAQMAVGNINLDRRESLPHPDERVEYEFWTNSNDECGPKCKSQIEFVKNFKGVAQILERKGGYTQFTPHYIT